MATLERLTKQGKELGYKDEELKTFVKEQQVIVRDERQAAHEAREAECEAERQKRDAIEKYESEIKVRLKNVNKRRERPNN